MRSATQLRRPLGRRGRAAVAGGALLALTACGGTTFDTTLVSTTAPAATTTTLPSGAAVDLLPRLVDEARAVPQLMIDGGDARGAVERLTALWAAVRDEVVDTRPDLVEAFEQQIDRFDRAVQYKRVADADKSLKNVVVLVDTYLA